MNINSLFNPRWKKSNYILKTKAYYYKTWDGYQMPSLHSHPSIEVMYVIKGKCFIEIEGDTVALNKGQFILIDANISHRLVVPLGKKCRMLNLEFGFEINMETPFDLKQMLEEETSLKKMYEVSFPYILLHDTDMVYMTLKKIIYHLDNQKKKTSLYIQFLYFQLLVDISHLWKEVINYKENINESHVDKALEYLHQHYDEDIKIIQVAQYVSLNENYLQRLFKEQMHMTIIEYLNHFRLEKATMFLSGTDYSMLEICDMIGINSRQYFIKLFKEQFLMTPGAYRKSITKGREYSMSE